MKQLSFGFILSSPLDAADHAIFFDGLDQFSKHLTLSYKVVDKKNGVVLSKRVANAAMEIRRQGDQVIVSTVDAFKVSSIHLNKSLVFLLLLEFNFDLSPAKSKVLEDEKEIRHAIENPKYRPQRINPRKGSLAFTLIEPLKISVESIELGAETTLVHVTIENAHPTNTIVITSTNLIVKTTVRDFDRDTAMKNGDDDDDMDDGASASVSARGMGYGLSEHEASSSSSDTSLDELNVEEYLRIIRADKFFMVTAVGDESDNPRRSECPEQSGVARIRPAETWRTSYKIVAKDPSHVIVGNFLTPLDIRFIDIADDGKADGTAADFLSGAGIGSHQGMSVQTLTSSTHVAWSVGTRYLNKTSLYGSNSHVYRLDTSSSSSSSISRNMAGLTTPHRSTLSRDGPVGASGTGTGTGPGPDSDGEISVMLEAPSAVPVNVLFQVVVRMTNLSNRSKVFHLGIDDSGGAGGDAGTRRGGFAPTSTSSRGRSTSSTRPGSSRRYIALECLTKLRILPPGETAEAIIQILPLQLGELVLNGFYLLDDEGMGGGAVDTHQPYTLRRFAHALPVIVQ